MILHSNFSGHAEMLMYLVTLLDEVAFTSRNKRGQSAFDMASLGDHQRCCDILYTATSNCSVKNNFFIYMAHYLNSNL